MSSNYDDSIPRANIFNLEALMLYSEGYSVKDIAIQLSTSERFINSCFEVLNAQSQAYHELKPEEQQFVQLVKEVREKTFQIKIYEEQLALLRAHDTPQKLANELKELLKQQGEAKSKIRK